MNFELEGIRLRPFNYNGLVTLPIDKFTFTTFTDNYISNKNSTVDQSQYAQSYHHKDGKVTSITTRPHFTGWLTRLMCSEMCSPLTAEVFPG